MAGNSGALHHTLQLTLLGAAMRRHYLSGSLVLIFSTAAYGAGFDCAKAATLVEKSICADKRLSELDDRLMTAYKGAMSASPDPKNVKAMQLSWLANERNKCQDAECLRGAYAKQVAKLSDIAARRSSREKTITGRISWGQGTSSIYGGINDDANAESADFDSRSGVAVSILAVCKIDDLCAVTGVVDDAGVLTSVSKVIKVKVEPEAGPRASAQAPEAKKQQAALAAPKPATAAVDLSKLPPCSHVVAKNTLKQSFDRSQWARANYLSVVEITNAVEIAGAASKKRQCTALLTLNNNEKTKVKYFMEPREGDQFFLSVEVGQ